jgi:putative spermidine/putrescine transport system permease protein
VLPVTDFSLRWYREALSYPGFLDAFRLSLELATLAAVITVALSFLAAYGLARYRPTGGAALKAFFTAPLLVSAVVFGIAMLQFVNRIGLYNQLSGLVLAHIVLVVPFAMRSLEVTLRTVPEELEWAAMILGRSRLGMLLRITLPLCARGLVTAFLFCFLLSFSEVTTTIFMTGPGLQTLPVRIYSYMSDRIDPTVAAVSALVVMVSLVLVAVLNLLGGLRRLTTQ